MGFDIASSKPAPVGKGKQVVEYHVDSEADITLLPRPGGLVANTSIALDRSTLNVWELTDIGWRKW